MSSDIWAYAVATPLGAYYLGSWVYAMFIATNPERLISKDPEEIISTPLEDVVRLCDNEVADGPSFGAVYGVADGSSSVNYTAVSKPSFGVLFLSATVFMAVDSWGPPDPYSEWFYVTAAFPMLLSMPLFLIGLFPIPLPRRIYPQWQAARRALRYRENYQDRTTTDHDPATSPARGRGPARGRRARRRDRANAMKTIPWPPSTWKTRWWLN